MMINKIPTHSLIVVGTGEGASFFRNCGTAHKVSLETEGQFQTGDFANEGPAGKSPPDQSDKESMEATFSKQLANHLYAMAHDGKFDHLVLVLDPGTLGEVRPLLHKEVRDKLLFDLAKTLTNVTTGEIEKALEACCC